MSETNGTGPDAAGPWHLVTIHAGAAPDVVERVAGELRRRRCAVERLAYERVRGPAETEAASTAAGAGASGAAHIVALVGARDIELVAARLRRLPQVLGVTWTPAG